MGEEPEDTESYSQTDMTGSFNRSKKIHAPLQSMIQSEQSRFTDGSNTGFVGFGHTPLM